MGKTNFTKVESSLEEGLRKMQMERLLTEADKASGKSPPSQPREKLTKEQKHLLKDLELNLLRLRQKDNKIFTKLKVKRSTVKKMINEAHLLKDEDWKHLSSLLKKTESLIKEQFPVSPDDKIIEGEKQKHINKRFNVNDKWLPLK